jgi:hypothetical protein
MNQYGLKTKTGSFLPRDAQRRCNGERFLRPDLWQDKHRAEELAKQYNCTLVTYSVAEVV